VKCATRVISLDSNEQYEALSYVWGERTNDDEDIQMSGQPVTVTRNLYAALKRLRFPHKRKRSLWVDQLCINQMDNLERASQVALMRDIYRGCFSCIVWLGELDETTDNVVSQNAAAVFSFIAAVARVSTVPLQGLPTLFQDTQEGEAVRLAFTAFAMYGNPWWSRIWTVQEAIIPKSAVFCWGPNVITRDDILTTSRHLRSDLMHHNFPQPFKEKRVQHYELLRRMLYPVHGFIHSNTHDGPLDLLMRWRHRHATDPRDKVYALMGLIPDDVLPSARGYDYNAPASLLFANVTYDLIRGEKGLRPFVGSCEMPHTTPDLPTWAIDFASSNRVGRRQLKWWNHSHRYREFSACADCTVQASLHEDGKCLALTGVLVDDIELKSDLYTVPDEVDVDSRKLYSTIIGWGELLALWYANHKNRSEYVAGGSLQSAFSRTCIGDLIMAEYPVERAKPAHERYFSKLLKSLSEGKTQGSLYESVCGMVPNHTFFITKQGYIGIGPPDTQPGDQVWVFDGGRVPFVARKTEQDNVVDSIHKLHLVGDTYVHGIMDGEAVQEDREAQTVWLY